MLADCYGEHDDDRGGSTAVFQKNSWKPCFYLDGDQDKQKEEGRKVQIWSKIGFIERLYPDLRTGYLLYVHATQYEFTI